MLLKTHLALGFLIALLFIPHVPNPAIFTILVLLTTYLPDIDTGFSTIGTKWYAKPLQWFVKHRGIIHSFTAATVLSLLVSFIWPRAALGVFLGYSVHLIADSFTKEGIQPFWPLKRKTNGFIRTGSSIEETLFMSLILIDLVVFVIVIFF
jgi:membrane-bound metal-dependent hydrolase YbcI (DUF457 family)